MNGIQEPILISSQVIDKFEYSGKGAEFELTIKGNSVSLNASLFV